MANFNTHYTVAAGVTGVCSAALLAANHIELNTCLWLWFLGTIGGLLPDIDSDNSTSLDSIFNILAVAFIISIIRYLSGNHYDDASLFELTFIPLVAYLVLRYGVRNIFERITVHRGICHSLLFVVFCSLVTVNMTWQLTYQRTSADADVIAWLSGGMLLLGCMIHLILDELWSIDWNGFRLKQSFGSAMKLVDMRSKLMSLIFAFAVAGLWFIAPELDNTLDVLRDWSDFSLL